MSNGAKRRETSLYRTTTLTLFPSATTKYTPALRFAIISIGILAFFNTFQQHINNYIMNNLQAVQPISVDNIKTKIYEFRGQKVMIDRDLADLYHIETKVLNQAVKRNIKRFPTDAMFILTKDEFESLRSQIVTSNKRGGARYMPYAFTELGIAMLSSVLSSEIAIQANLNIMRAFILMKHAFHSFMENSVRFEKIEHQIATLNSYIEDVLRDQNDINDDTAAQLELINQTLAELQAENTIRKQFAERKPVGFKIEK